MNNVGVAVCKGNFISKQNQILTSITKIWKYFPKGRPKREGGLVLTNFLLTHNKSIENIISNIKYQIERCNIKLRA